MWGSKHGDLVVGVVPVLNQGAQMRGEGGWDQGGSGRVVRSQMLYAGWVKDDAKVYGLTPEACS